MNDVIEAPARQASIVPQQDGRSSVADVISSCGPSFALPSAA